MSRVPLGFWLFAVALCLSWANSAIHVALSDRPMYIRSIRIFQNLTQIKRIVCLLVLSLGYLALVGLFLVGWHRPWIALVILGVLLSIRRFEIAQWPGDIVVRLGKYVPAAACLLAWLVSSSVLAWLGHERVRAEALGWDAACGVMAGAHVLAGIAKVRESGWVWLLPKYQSLLVAERAYVGPRILRGLRWSIASSKTASLVVGATGFSVELLAGLFVVPELRPFLLGVILLLYTGFLVLLGYFEIEWMLVLTAITLLAR